MVGGAREHWCALYLKWYPHLAHGFRARHGRVASGDSTTEISWKSFFAESIRLTRYVVSR